MALYDSDQHVELRNLRCHGARAAVVLSGVSNVVVRNSVLGDLAGDDADAAQRKNATAAVGIVVADSSHVTVHDVTFRGIRGGQCGATPASELAGGSGGSAFGVVALGVVDSLTVTNTRFEALAGESGCNGSSPPRDGDERFLHGGRGGAAAAVAVGTSATATALTVTNTTIDGVVGGDGGGGGTSATPFARRRGARGGTGGRGGAAGSACGVCVVPGADRLVGAAELLGHQPEALSPDAELREATVTDSAFLNIAGGRGGAAGPCTADAGWGGSGGRAGHAAGIDLRGDHSSVVAAFQVAGNFFSGIVGGDGGSGAAGQDTDENKPAGRGGSGADGGHAHAVAVEFCSSGLLRDNDVAGVASGVGGVGGAGGVSSAVRGSQVAAEGGDGGDGGDASGIFVAAECRDVLIEGNAVSAVTAGAGALGGEEGGDGGTARGISLKYATSVAVSADNVVSGIEGGAGGHGGEGGDGGDGGDAFGVSAIGSTDATIEVPETADAVVTGGAGGRGGTGRTRDGRRGRTEFVFEARDD